MKLENLINTTEHWSSSKQRMVFKGGVCISQCGHFTRCHWLDFAHSCALRIILANIRSIKTSREAAWDKSSADLEESLKSCKLDYCLDLSSKNN